MEVILPKRDTVKLVRKKVVIYIVNFITTYNPSLPDVNQLIRKHLPVLHGDDSLNSIWSRGPILPFFI